MNAPKKSVESSDWIELLKQKKLTRELFVTKKDELDWISHSLNRVINEELDIPWVKAKVYNRYLVKGLSNKDFKNSVGTIFSEKPVDEIHSNTSFSKSIIGWKKLSLGYIKKSWETEDNWEVKIDNVFAPCDLSGCYSEEQWESIGWIYYKIDWNKTILNIESLPWQYDARVDAIQKLLMVQTWEENNSVSAQTTIVLEWELSIDDIKRIRERIINPVKKCDRQMGKYEDRLVPEEDKWFVMDWFTSLSNDDLIDFIKKYNLAMDIDDISLVQEYFRDEEKRDPTNVEMKVIETYWSDHCRHTTFNTHIEEVKYTWKEWWLIESIKEAEKQYKETRDSLWRWDKPTTLMDVVTTPKRYFQKNPEKNPSVKDIDESEEINACSFKVTVEMEDGTTEEWLIMYKNETHNHPTEIEPFGWAATCIGWCIRDPASWRAWVWWGMRLSGTSDPTEPISETIAWKLPQALISRLSAEWFSSYWNQIWIHTWVVQEFFHPWYVAKNFQVGYVIGWAPTQNIRREKPENGDLVLMVWGRTGNDWTWWASGASKVQNEQSVTTCWAEVQQWNALTERAITILLRDPRFTRLIKRCNDFWAWGVAVAVWELSRWLNIDLDQILTKYPIGALVRMISESQERMAFVIDEEDYEEAMTIINEYNLEGRNVATVTDSVENPENDRLNVTYKWEKVVNISRDFLDKAWATKKANAEVVANEENYFNEIHDEKLKELIMAWNIKEAFLYNLSRKSVASQKWLWSIFDSSVWATTVISPFGWKNQLTHQNGMVCKIPTYNWIDAITTTISSLWFNPYLCENSPFLGAIYWIIESVSKCIVIGWNIEKTFLSLQEYFEKLWSEEKRWGKAYQAILWAFKAQMELLRLGLWWKDSTSWTFKKSDGSRIDVPPWTVSFATSIWNINKTISAEFKKSWNSVIHFPVQKDSNGVPNWEEYMKNLKIVSALIDKWYVSSSSTIWAWGLSSTIHNMCIWNDIWFQFDKEDWVFNEDMWGIVLELNKEPSEIGDILWEWYTLVWKTLEEEKIIIGDQEINLSETKKSWEKTFEEIFPTSDWGAEVDLIQSSTKAQTRTVLYDQYWKPLVTEKMQDSPNIIGTPPTVLIPVFPGTNSELDTQHAIIKAGMKPVLFYFNTLTSQSLIESTKEFARLLKDAQMLSFVGWFSWGDEPDWSAKFIASVFRMKQLKEAVNAFLGSPDTLTLWICNWFQALIKLGIFKEWLITDCLEKDDFTLTYNKQRRHITDNVWLIVNSVMSPLMSLSEIWKEYVIPVSHWEWRFYIDEKYIAKIQTLIDNWQVVMQYIDSKTWKPTSKYNGSIEWIAAICSPDWRVLWLMPHPERTWKKLFQNIPWDHELDIFKSAAYSFGVGVYKNL